MRGPGHGMTRKVVCAGAQSINYLGPVVKPRDDTREQSSKCKEQSANVVSRCDSINYLGPVVKPRDDKKGEPCSAGPGPRDDKESCLCWRTEHKLPGSRGQATG